MVSPVYPTVWYHVVGDVNPTTQVFENTSGSMVANSSANYLSWIANGGSTTRNGPQKQITAAVNNGSGLIRLTVNDTTGMTTGDAWAVQNVGGTTEANGVWLITVVSAGLPGIVDLQGSAFVHAYTSGGVIDRGEFISTQAGMYTQIDAFNKSIAAAGAFDGSNTTFASGTVVLTNPMKALQIASAAGAITYNLPLMNVYGAIPIGKSIHFQNTMFGNPGIGASVRAQDNVTVLGTIRPGSVLQIQSTANDTQNGTWV